MASDETTLLIDMDSKNNFGFEQDDGWNETLAEINLDIGEQVKAPPVAAASSGHVYNYDGVEIRFPYPAYRSQQLMMEKMIEGLKKGENCLLESPTGTGKTAALLCALLAWQKDCYDKNYNCADIIEKAAEKLGGCSCGLIVDKERTKRVTMSLDKTSYEWSLTSNTIYEEEEELPYPDSSTFSSTIGESLMLTQTLPTCDISSNVENNGGSPSKRRKTFRVHTETRTFKEACGYCKKKHVYDRSCPPKIYYCTRTHSQMVQVVKQLKDTAYRGARMTILASRIATCISEKAAEEVKKRNSEAQHRSHKVDVNDICREWKKNYFLNKDVEKKKDSGDEEDEKKLEKSSNEERKPVCDYFVPNTEGQLSSAFARILAAGAWDFEDIKNEGRECETCPYYGSYALHNEANIVFGSYNYLIDPSLREFHKIKYINSVIVFDEAHNIEDICRSSFSFTLDVEKFKDEILGFVNYLLWKVDNKEFKVYAKFDNIVALKKLQERFEKWLVWLAERSLNIAPSRVKEDVKEPFENQKLFDALIEMGMDSEGVDACVKLASKLDGSEPPAAKGKDDGSGGIQEDDYYIELASGRRRPFRLSRRVGEFLKNMKQTLEYLCEEKDGVGGAKDFKGYLTRTLNTPAPRRQSTQSELITIIEPTRPEFNFIFDVICLNPAVGFRELRNTAFSIIVASGTLTPLESFSSELATPFAITLQADHVIPSSSVWAGVILAGPKKLSMSLTKRHQDDLEIQDEIGNIICEICYSVPNGVLVFLPSYTLMNKLKIRWNSYPRGYPLIKKIERKKRVFYEESRDKKLFKQQMEQYKELVKGGVGFDGCILFAVFRGKISEGIDFADEQARSVVTIGIPFSNVGAAEIVAKKEYNDKRKQQQLPDELILSGSEWYKIQAYRAMNQGFGRCVRHQSDWGAVVMIESRLGQRQNHPYLSGWVQKNLKVYEDFEEAKQKLDLFIRARKGQAKFKRSVKIEYEANPGQSTSCDNSKEQSFNQSLDFHDLPTQQIDLLPSPIATSSPLHHPNDIGESSPEYSFSDEVESIMGTQTQRRLAEAVNPTEGMVRERDDSSSSSISVYGQSPMSSPVRGGLSLSNPTNDRDMELSVVADQVHGTNDGGDSNAMQQQNGYNFEASDASILDISMPSVNDLSQMSQASSVSYNSDLEI